MSAPVANRRRFARVPAALRLVLEWPGPDGAPRRALARTCDVSAGGWSFRLVDDGVEVPQVGVQGTGWLAVEALDVEAPVRVVRRSAPGEGAVVVERLSAGLEARLAAWVLRQEARRLRRGSSA